MTDVILIHGPAEEQMAATLAARFHAKGMTAHPLSTRSGFVSTDLSDQVKRAEVVLVMLPREPGPDDRGLGDVIELANRKSRLVFASFTGSPDQLQAQQAPVFDLSRWKGAEDNPTVLSLVDTVYGMTYRPRNVRRKGLRLLLLGGSTGGIIAVAFSLTGMDLFNLQQQVCAFPSPEPWSWLSDSCGAMGLGDRPKREERLAWEARDPTSCPALLAHLRRFPDGALAPQAVALYAARVSYESGQSIVSNRRLPLYVGAAPEGSDSREKALARGQRSAQSLCGLYATDASVTLVDYTVTPEDWRCNLQGCSFEGSVICKIAVKEVLERCDPA